MFFNGFSQCFEEELSDGNVDCPPGFEPMIMEPNNHAKPADSASSDELSSRTDSLSSIHQTYFNKGAESIIEDLENELHLSVNMALVDHVKKIVEAEVQKCFDSKVTIPKAIASGYNSSSDIPFISFEVSCYVHFSTGDWLGKSNFSVRRL